MVEEEYHLMVLLENRPLPFPELAVKLNGGQDSQSAWDRAEALVHKGYLHHYLSSGTYGSFGLSDLGRVELSFYKKAFGLNESAA